MSDALPPAGALAGVRVLDLSTGIAGPFGARLLGDFGAEVIKVEPPGGDSGRALPPIAASTIEGEGSLLFQYLHWNKRGIVLDLSDHCSHAALRALVERSDVVIESFAAGTLAGWGLGADAFMQWNPQVVVTSVTDFGQAGPHAAFRGSDVVHQAMAGIMQISGSADRAPLKHGLDQVGFGAGLNVAYASLAALHAAKADGVGEHVDLSIHECMVSELVMCETYYSFMGAVQSRRLPVQDPFAGGPIATRDGFVSIQSGGPAPLEGYADVFGEEALRSPRFVDSAQRAANVEEFRALVERCARERSAKDLFLDGSARRMLMGMVQGARELLACEQLASRRFSEIVEHPATGAHRFPVRMAQLSRNPTSVRRRAPLLAEHQDEVLLELQQPWPARPVRPDATPRLPLAGLRVLDLSTVVAVPYMAALLGDLGAEVIKIESPVRLDQTRRGVFTTYLDNQSGEGAIDRSGIFQVLNRNKRSVVLDLSCDAGRAVFRDLVATADIVLENFTPRVLRGWALHYDELRKIRPGLVMLSNTGYGATGPWSGFPSQGTTLEATMGISAFSGYRGDKPWKVGQSYPDFIACWMGLTALFAALHALRATGEGQWIDLSMYQVGAALVPEALLQYQVDGTQPERIGNEHSRFVPSNAYRVEGDDRWVALTVETDSQWLALAGAMERPDLASAFASAAARLAHRDAVDSAVAEWMRGQDARGVTHRLQALGIACGPVQNNRDLLLDEHLAARGFHERVEHPPPIGMRPIMGRPYRWTLRQPHVHKPAPAYGEDNRSVLGELPGYTPAHIAQLLAARVVCDTPHRDLPPQAMGLAHLARLRAVSEVDADYRRRLGIDGA
ncbi:MAG: CoA transferase [Gammaproteobacteria bacterium]|nr:CoA transferase [Gammaproteobacteria bacterium]